MRRASADDRQEEPHDSIHRYHLLLMRHGSRPLGTASAAEGVHGLSENGCNEVTSVAEVLAETLEGLRRPGLSQYQIKLNTIWHAESAAASTTATLVANELRKHGLFGGTPVPNSTFNPAHASPYSAKSSNKEMRKAIDEVKRGLGAGLRAGDNAILVVGHQPLLGLVAREWGARLPWSRLVVPLARGEVACLAGPSPPHSVDGGRWRLLWTVAPADDTAMEALRVKLQSKMTVASILGSVIGSGLVLLLDGLLAEQERWASPPVALRYGAALSWFLSAWLFLATMYFCDRLLMPTRFWGEAKKPAALHKRPRWLVWRPPGPSAWVVYQNMLRTWRWFFTPGLYLLAFGALLMAVAVFRPHDWGDAFRLIGAFLPGALALLGYSFWRRPQLGVED
jgi:phosphohistidine phosphatase SixA